MVRRDELGSPARSLLGVGRLIVEACKLPFVLNPRQADVAETRFYDCGASVGKETPQTTISPAAGSCDDAAILQ